MLNLLIDTLKNYKQINDEIKHIKEEIEILKIKSMNPRTTIISDMPKGSPIENDKMAALMIKFEELEQRYINLLHDLMDKQQKIEDAIESLEPIERDLIRYRYIDCLPWFKIEEKLSYSSRSVFRMHRKILKKMAQQGI
jgi:DNA-directed RNA polymerase specialized sigma subunit